MDGKRHAGHTLREAGVPIESAPALTVSVPTWSHVESAAHTTTFTVSIQCRKGQCPVHSPPPLFDPAFAVTFPN